MNIVGTLNFFHSVTPDIDVKIVLRMKTVDLINIVGVWDFSHLVTPEMDVNIMVCMKNL